MATEKPGQIRALLGARAFPPLLLVMYHFCEGHGYRNFWPLDYVVARGYLWVEFFFALSGFVLTYAYGPRMAQVFTPGGYGNFLKSRLIRLYPLHLFMLLAILATAIATRQLAAMGHYVSIFDLPYHSFIDAKAFVLNLLLMQAWHTEPHLTWNGAAWFVSVEWALCLMFPLFLWLSNGRVWRAPLLIIGGFVALWALALTFKHGLDITFDGGVLRGMADFAIGVGLCMLYREWRPRDRLPEAAHSIIQLLLLGALFYAFYNNGWAHNMRDLWVMVPLMALLLALSFDRGILARLLQMALPQRLGEWSYAIYIGQTFFLLWIRVAEQRLYPPLDMPMLGTTFGALSFWLEPLLLVLACIAWGALLATFVETPVARWLKNVTERRLDRTPVLPT